MICIEDNDLKDMIKTDFDREEVHKHWNDKNYFFCAFKKTCTGKIILENANLTLFRLFDRSCNCCGKDIESFLPAKYADELSEMLRSGETERKAYRYFREFPCSDRTWCVTAISYKKIIKMAGRILNDYSRLIPDGRINDVTSHNDINTDFVGTVILSSGNGRLVSEMCSDNIRSFFPALSEKCDLIKATSKDFGKYLTLSTVSALLLESIKRNIPLTFYNLFAPGHGIAPILLRLTVFPVVSAACAMAAVTIRKAKEELTDAPPRSIGSACCEVCRSASGSVYIRSMDDRFYELLKKEEGMYDLICSGDMFSSWKDSRAENRTIRGHNGVIYNVKVIPGTDNTGTDSFFIMADILPTDNYPKKISPREGQALSLAARGYTNRYIAHVLGISEGTVKKLIHNGYEKLGISSRVELVKLFPDKK